MEFLWDWKFETRLIASYENKWVPRNLKSKNELKMKQELELLLLLVIASWKRNLSKLLVKAINKIKIIINSFIL